MIDKLWLDPAGCRVYRQEDLHTLTPRHIDNLIPSVLFTLNELIKLNKLRRDVRLYIECVSKAFEEGRDADTTEEQHILKQLDELDILFKEK